MCGSVRNFVLFYGIINIFTTFFGFIVLSTAEAAHPKRICVWESRSYPRRVKYFYI